MKNHVDQIMSRKLITVGMSDSMRKAYQMMQEHRIRHLPVLDAEGVIIGILSDRDTRRAMRPQKEPLFSEGAIIEFDPKLSVQHFMSWPVKDRKSTRLNSSHSAKSRMPSSA